MARPHCPRCTDHPYALAQRDRTIPRGHDCYPLDVPTSPTSRDPRVAFHLHRNPALRDYQWVVLRDGFPLPRRIDALTACGFAEEKYTTLRRWKDRGDLDPFVLSAPRSPLVLDARALWAWLQHHGPAEAAERLAAIASLHAQLGR